MCVFHGGQPMNELFPASEPWGGGLPPRPLQSSCHYQARRSWDVGRGRGWAGHRRAFRRVSSLTGEWRVVVISCPLARVGRGGGGVGKPCRVWGASPSGDGHRSFWKAAEQTWAEGAHPARVGRRLDVLGPKSPHVQSADGAGTQLLDVSSRNQCPKAYETVSDT